MHGGKRHAGRVLLEGGRGDFKEGDRLEGQGVDGRIIVKWMVKK
jgi:hypothetical protein